MAVKRSRNYTIIDNEIFNDSSISMKAKGLLCQLLSFPDGLDFPMEKLPLLFNDTEQEISNALKELERHGYLKLIFDHADNGELQIICEVNENKKN